MNLIQWLMSKHGLSRADAIRYIATECKHAFYEAFMTGAPEGLHYSEGIKSLCVEVRDDGIGSFSPSLDMSEILHASVSLSIAKE